MQLRVFIYLGIAAFFAFSIGLNFGLLGFHNFHFEGREDEVLNVGVEREGGGEGREKHRVRVLQRRGAAEVPGDEVKAEEVAVLRDTSSLDMPQKPQKAYKKDSAPVISLPVAHTEGPKEDKSEHVFPPPLQNTPHSLSVVSTPKITKPSVSSNPFAAMGNGPIASFLQQGGEIPIVLITCNRVELLEQTIQNLMKVRHITKDIVVMQDGTMRGIADTAKAHGLEVVQNKEDNRRLRGNDGASRIATHYKFSLTTIFNMRPHAPAAIIIEDDLLFSPDFYEYFLYNAAVIEQDKTVFAVSAWSDNGFKGRVQDPHALRRTEFFPGLGWLLSRELYKNELEPKWPKSHWDHWLRAPETHKGREIVYPQVPRTYHNGIKGTFMNMDTHNQYFRDIAYNQDPSVVWASVSEKPLYESVIASNYEARIKGLMSECRHVRDVQDFVNHQSKVYCIWIKEDPDPRYGNPPFQPIAKVFGIWHEHKRGVHKGMHEFFWSPTKGKEESADKSYFLLLNTYGGSRSYEALKPRDVPLLTPTHFKALLPHLRGAH